MASGRDRSNPWLWTAGAAPASGALVLALFASTLLLSGLLLFWLQPMFVRRRCGAGYAYPPATSRLLSRLRQVLLHLGLLALAAQTVPIGVARPRSRWARAVRSPG